MASVKILAIDTSSDLCSAALSIDGQIEQRLERQPRRHSELILRMMDDLLAAAELRPTDLDALAYGAGPGSFTGLRIAAGVVQGSAFGIDRPVVPISTLAALAQGHYRLYGRGQSLPALDARMGEVYWGAYRLDLDGLMQPVSADQVAMPDTVGVPEAGSWHGIGSGWSAQGAALRARLGARLVGVDPGIACEAHDIAVLAAAAYAAGRAVVAEDALPVYLRDRVTADR